MLGFAILCQLIKIKAMRSVNKRCKSRRLRMCFRLCFSSHFHILWFTWKIYRQKERWKSKRSLRFVFSQMLNCNCSRVYLHVRASCALMCRRGRVGMRINVSPLSLQYSKVNAILRGISLLANHSSIKLRQGSGSKAH